MPFDRFGRIASVDPHANAVGMAGGSGSELPPATLALLAAVPVAAAAASGALSGAPLRGGAGAPDTLRRR